MRGPSRGVNEESLWVLWGSGEAAIVESPEFVYRDGEIEDHGTDRD